jgi:methyl-accepting chemotaxis protein
MNDASTTDPRAQEKPMKIQLAADSLLNMLFGGLLVGLAAVGAFGYYALEESHERTVAALQSGRDLGAAAVSVRAADVAAHTQAAEVDQLLAMRAPDVGGAAPRPDLPRKWGEVVQKHLDDAGKLLTKHGLDAGRLEDASRLQAKLTQQAELRLKQAAAGEQALPGAEKWNDVAQTVESAVQRHTEKLAQDSADRTRSIGLFVAIVILVGMALAVVVRSLVLRANGRPLFAAIKLAEQIAAGDLTAKAEGMDQPHTRKLARSLDGMTGNLRALAMEVVRSAKAVADTSGQIAQGNLDLSQRTEEQASTLEETASSMEELTSTVAQNADNARKASELAVSASEVARKGGQVVGQVVATMTDISQSSRKIGDIIGVIDGIAFQTNILALNAAVEAARAGEQGRGFAVVASEVRNLAQRSAAAAKEIKTLIGDSVNKVEAGTKLVDSAGKTMDEIVASVKQVKDLIAEIAAASQEQSAGIGQVNTAVAQMEQVVQQNASLVEEATAATESMKEQAVSLLRMVERFKLGEQAAPVTALQPAGSWSAAPAPIKVRAATALPPVYAAASRKPQGQSGNWEEF